MFVDEREYRVQAAHDEIIDFLPRIHLPREPAELHALRFFERDAEAERDIVRDMARARREDLDRYGDALVVDDDGDGLRADIREDASLHLLVAFKEDIRSRDRRGHLVDDLDIRLFDRAR